MSSEIGEQPRFTTPEEAAMDPWPPYPTPRTVLAVRRIDDVTAVVIVAYSWTSHWGEKVDDDTACICKKRDGVWVKDAERAGWMSLDQAGPNGEDLGNSIVYYKPPMGVTRVRLVQGTHTVEAEVGEDGYAVLYEEEVPYRGSLPFRLEFLVADEWQLDAGSG